LACRKGDVRGCHTMTAGRANISLNYEERFVRAVARDVAEYQQLFLAFVNHISETSES
jgi:hypothetical protein